MSAENKTYVVSRKYQLHIDGDKEEVNRVYQYLRDAIYNQNKAYNILISHVYAAIYSGKSTEEINEIYKRGKRKPKEDNPEYSLYKFGEINFPVGVPIASSVGMMVKDGIKKAKADGLFKGQSSLPNRQLDAPLRIESQCFSFYYEQENYPDFLDDLFHGEPKVHMKFVNGIHFSVVFGNPHKSHEMRCVFQNIFEEKYRVLGSSIQIDGNKIILNLSLEMPKQQIELDENIVVGVDLGLAIPAMCSLNTNNYVRLPIGSYDDFARVRTRIQAQKRRLQKSLKMSNGGHGRKKKLKPLDRFTEYEKHWVETYNHKVSKMVVDFALKNRAKYINMEDLTGFDTSQFLLRNWSYYQLQSYITYKAEKYGIIVRKVNPAYTSQTCSCCGFVSAENRPKQEKGQAYFKCVKCGVELNADFNGSQNIARSTDFTDGTKSKSNATKPKKIVV